jgi:large-conductance mechanosensitive channel
MYGILINIFAYTLMSLGAYRAFSFSHSYGSRFTMILNYLLLFWCVFMSLYLSSQMQEILEKPLNEKLNLYEAFTNIIIAGYLLSFNLKHKE